MSLAVLLMAWSGCANQAQDPDVPRVDPNQLKPFDDLRHGMLKMSGVSLAEADFRDKKDVLLTVSFNSKTPWPVAEKMPKGFEPAEILERGKNPGLGVRKLHDQGITGQGVRVGIIDQPLLREHREYRGKVAMYTAIDCADFEPQMHGAAVAALLVGESCGVAPRASLYYWAVPTWKRDYAQPVTALQQILEFNKDKPLTKRIRAVSISVGFNPNFAHLQNWKDALNQARKSGVIVIHCDMKMLGARCPLGKDADDPAQYRLCYFAKEPGRFPRHPLGLWYLPIDNRTTASFEGTEDYFFDAKGGLSWAAPYLAGVIALGLQVNPQLNEEAVFDCLKKSATPFQGGWLVNPPQFIKRIPPQETQGG